MKPITVIKQSSTCVGHPISSWYVRKQQAIHGQFQSEVAACAFAMECLTAEAMKAGKPLDQYTMRQAITFEENTAYQDAS